MECHNARQSSEGNNAAHYVVTGEPSPKCRGTAVLPGESIVCSFKERDIQNGCPLPPQLSLAGLTATLLPFQVPPKVHCTRACNAVLLRERRISCSLFYVPGPFSFTVTGWKKMKTCQIAKSNNATSPAFAAKNILFILKLLYLQSRR